MAKAYEFEINAHPSIYLPQERQLKIYFSKPEQGINNDTGILLLIAGFGGHANSNVYKKMRNEFADNYNLITLQCDYFGWEFMQMPNSIYLRQEDIQQNLSAEEQKYLATAGDIMDKFTVLLKKKKFFPPFYEYLDETYSNFNDMGIMQAIDNVSAVIAVLAILEDNQYFVNKNKILIYGHSQGAYLGYLCNAIAPQMFSLLVDNSAWLFPEYLNGSREVTLNEEMLIIFEYLAAKAPFDKEFLTLNSLYQKFENNCKIISYHGIDDTLVTLKDKEEFAKRVKNMELYAVHEDMLDGESFCSTKHGLDSDFLKLFQMVINQNLNYERKKPFSLENVEYKTKKAHYYIDYSRGLPILTLL